MIKYLLPLILCATSALAQTYPDYSRTYDPQNDAVMRGLQENAQRADNLARMQAQQLQAEAVQRQLREMQSASSVQQHIVPLYTQDNWGIR